jgi:hypothetical protein
MRYYLVASLCAGILAVSHPSGAQNRKSGIVALRASSLTIRGSTTIGAKWSCTATDIDASAGMQSGPVEFTAETVQSVSVSVPVSLLRCQSGAMERAMRKAMRAEWDSTSSIVGSFATHPTAAANDASGVHLNGTITVAGVRQPIVFNVAVDALSDSVFRVRSTLPLTLHAFNITPPRVLWGAVRARDAITVEVDLRFQKPTR